MVGDYWTGFTTAQKRNFFEEALGQWPVVQVHFLDHPGLRVPKPCRPTNRLITVGSEQAIGMVPVMFEYGLDLPVPIPDLKITDEGISATLSFSREPHPTFVPWEAVVKIGRKLMDDNIAIGYGTTANTSDSVEVQSKSPVPVRGRPKLKLVP